MTVPAPQPNPQPVSPPTIPPALFMGMPSSVPARADSFIDRMLARYGTAENALREMATQIVQYSDTAQRYEAENQKLKESALPDGAVVIPKDKAPLWKAVTEANLTPETLATTLKEHREWGGRITISERSGRVAKAAKAAGIANPEMLDILLAHRNQEIELRPVAVADPKNPGQTVTVEQPYVRTRDKADAVAEPLTSYGAREFSPAEQAALRAVAATTGQPATGLTAAPMAGVPWPPQQPVNQPQPDVDYVAQFQKNAQQARDKRPSPLAAAAQAGRGTTRQPEQAAPATPAAPGSTPA